MILLDTDIMVDFLRDYEPAVSWLSSAEEHDFVLPGFVVMELIQGCRNRKEQELIKSKISTYWTIWPTSDMCEHALKTFTENNLQNNLGIIDALIGQMAVDLGVPLFTGNTKHYKCINGIRAEQPYKK